MIERKDIKSLETLTDQPYTTELATVYPVKITYADGKEEYIWTVGQFQGDTYGSDGDVYLSESAPSIFSLIEAAWEEEYSDAENDEVTQLNWDTFVDEYKPILAPDENGETDENGAFDGYMFETFGTQNDIVSKYPYTKIWTIVESDDGELAILVPGIRHVNRIGYILTQKEWTPYMPNEEIIIGVN